MSERISPINRLRRRLGRGYQTFDPSSIMPDKFHELATYNLHVSQGVEHTAAMKQRMAALQAEFDEWSASKFDRWKADR